MPACRRFPKASNKKPDIQTGIKCDYIQRIRTVSPLCGKTQCDFSMSPQQRYFLTLDPEKNSPRKKALCEESLHKCLF